MSGPTFSPDGDWMWNGTGWIPAPPKEQVLPQSAINQTIVTNVATESSVDPGHLTQVAPYFDENKDRILQQTEIQQAAMSIANQPNVPFPQPAHKQQFAPPAPTPAPMPAPPMGGMMPASRGKAPSALNWVVLGLTAAAITLIFIAMFSNSWMTGDEDNTEFYFGLSEWEVEYEVPASDSDSSYGDGDGSGSGCGNGAGDQNADTPCGEDEFETESKTRDYSGKDCDDDECSDMDSAGTTGLVFLWIAVVVAIGSLVLIGLNSFGVYQSKFGMISAFVSGGLSIIGIIIWLSMFPEIEDLDDFDLGPGLSFYLAMIGGLLGIAVGILEIFAGKSGGKSLNSPVQGMPQQQYNQQQHGQPKQYQQW